MDSAAVAKEVLYAWVRCLLHALSLCRNCRPTMWSWCQRPKAARKGPCRWSPHGIPMWQISGVLHQHCLERMRRSCVGTWRLLGRLRGCFLVRHSAGVHQLDDWALHQNRALHQSRACVSHAAHAQHLCVQHVRTCSFQHEQMLSGRYSRPAHPYHALLKPAYDTVEIFKNLLISLICPNSAISNDAGAKQSPARL